MSVFFHDVEVHGRRTNVVVDGPTIIDVAPTTGAPSGATVIDGEGAALVPGLHDHHLHLFALAAAIGSVSVGPLDTPDRESFAATLRTAARDAPSGQWIRAVGYHERVAGSLDRWMLDEIVGDRPVRVQHRSGGLWTVNSRGLAALGLLEGDAPPGCERYDDGTRTGRLFRLDDWLADRWPAAVPDLAAAGRLLIEQGFTGVTDATPFESIDRVVALADARLPLRLTVMGSPRLPASDVPDGLAVGPAKLLLHDHDLPDLAQVVAEVRTARRAGRAIAVHCVTRVALVLTLAAFDEVGAVAGDRIEHGAVIPPELFEPLLRHGLTVVTQPNFVAERGDEYLTDVEADDVPHLWRASSLLDTGIPIGGGTDAPFGRADPWALVAAARDRRTPGGSLLGEDERLDAARALRLLLGAPNHPGGPSRRVEPGATADLCLLDAPLEGALAAAPANPVRLVVIDGQITASR